MCVVCSWGLLLWSSSPHRGREGRVCCVSCIAWVLVWSHWELYLWVAEGMLQCPADGVYWRGRTCLLGGWIWCRAGGGVLHALGQGVKSIQAGLTPDACDGKLYCVPASSSIAIQNVGITFACAYAAMLCNTAGARSSVSPATAPSKCQQHAACVVIAQTRCTLMR